MIIILEHSYKCKIQKESRFIGRVTSFWEWTVWFKTGINQNQLKKKSLLKEVDCPAEGFVIEARRSADDESKSCTVLIQKGTLKVFSLFYHN